MGRMGTFWMVPFCISSTQNAKSPVRDRAFVLNFLGWLMGLEPTTTGITILDSTN